MPEGVEYKYNEQMDEHRMNVSRLYFISISKNQTLLTKQIHCYICVITVDKEHKTCSNQEQS